MTLLLRGACQGTAGSAHARPLNLPKGGQPISPDVANELAVSETVTPELGRASGWRRFGLDLDCHPGIGSTTEPCLDRALTLLE